MKYFNKITLYDVTRKKSLILILPIFFRLFLIHLKLELLTQFPAPNDEKNCIYEKIYMTKM